MRPLCCKCLHSSVLCAGDLCGTCWQAERTGLAAALREFGLRVLAYAAADAASECSDAELVDAVLRGES